MKVHAEPKRIAEPLAGGKEGATVSVELLSGGEVTFPGAYFEASGGRLQSLHAFGIGTPRSRWWWVPCPAFLIRHPEAGPVLVDTALHPSVATKPHESMGRGYSWYSRPRLQPGHDIPAQLRQRGLDARDIPTVVMTHLHQDHASGMSEFPNSRFIISEPEWVAATTVPRPMLHGYRRTDYDYAFDYRLLSYDGERIDSYATFGRTFDLFGDGSIRLAFTPGHTEGHQSVICRLSDRDLVIAGDAIYTLRQLEGGPEPPRPEDERLWHRSLQELSLFHREYPHAPIIPGHDPRVWPSLEKRYQ